MSKYHIITFGCQMNKSDSERIKSVFEHLKYSLVDEMEQADFVVINACSVRQTAMDRALGLLKELEKKPQIKRILTGCVLPEDKEKYKKRFDLIFNIKDLSELEKFLHDESEYVNEDYFDVLPSYSNSYQAFVPIMTGCNNYCSYCAVPYVRGRETSRTVKDVLAEIKALAKKGYKEIQLLGQNVNSYDPVDVENFAKDNPYDHNFAKLLWEVNRINYISRIHFTSSHPKDMSDEVLHALGLSKLLNYLHLPLQSGDDDILKAMNRNYTARDYFRIVKKLRKFNPNIAIGTDIMLGFPGETREMFENTLKFYKKVKFDISFNATYSPRGGTASANLEDDVSQDEKRRRWHELHAVMMKIALEKSKKFIGKTVSVLIDKKTSEFCEGNSREMKRVRVYDCDCNEGDLIDVEVKEAVEWVLKGTIKK
ncbi:tRNA (N6-isopentenyl adenosine(37)-C2)-methylthiotransferase MiaB [Candidatus Falkowbacteria bacterium]|nr:tRNA (N6-isopentenyl adenosine(37)-C2)-methylthiotransferase MiaB [Candidatus Falkowbacteria bacterium]